MSKLIISRHGNTFEEGEIAFFVGSRSDLPLTKRGQEQAGAVGNYLRSTQFKPTRVICGNLERQHATATLAAQALAFSGEIEIDAALNEIDYGAWEGKTPAQIERVWPLQYRAWTENRTWPEKIFAENESDFRSRINGWLVALLNDKRDVFAVTSNGVLVVLYSLLQSMTGEKPGISAKVKTGHICIVEHGPGKIQITDWNLDPYSPASSVSPSSS